MARCRTEPARMNDSGSGGFACRPYCTGFRSRDEAIVQRPSQFSCARADGDMRERGRAKGAYGFIHASATSVLLLSSHGRPMVGVLGPAMCHMSSKVKWQSFVAVHSSSLRRNASGDRRLAQPVAGEGKCETLP